MTIGIAYLLIAAGIGLGVLLGGVLRAAMIADLRDALDQAERDRDAARAAAAYAPRRWAF